MKNYEQEIHDLHQFFEDYLKGIIASEPLDRMQDTLDTGFTIVTSEGQVIDKEGIVNYVRDNHHQRPNFSIWTENVSLKQHIGDLMVVTYEEWQTINNATTSRTSTVVFKEDDTMPNGLVWLHVHESGLKTIE